MNSALEKATLDELRARLAVLTAGDDADAAAKAKAEAEALQPLIERLRADKLKEERQEAEREARHLKSYEDARLAGQKAAMAWAAEVSLEEFRLNKRQMVKAASSQNIDNWVLNMAVRSTDADREKTIFEERPLFEGSISDPYQRRGWFDGFESVVQKLADGLREA